MLEVELERLIKLALGQTVLHTRKPYTNVACSQVVQTGVLGLELAVLDSPGLELAMTQIAMLPHK
jgi:hypothetical protein